MSCLVDTLLKVIYMVLIVIRVDVFRVKCIGTVFVLDHFEGVCFHILDPCPGLIGGELEPVAVVIVISVFRSALSEKRFSVRGLVLYDSAVRLSGFPCVAIGIEAVLIIFGHTGELRISRVVKIFISGEPDDVALSCLIEHID